MCKELKLTTIALTIAAILLVSGCASAITTTTTVDASDAPSFSYVHDFSEPKSPEGAVRIMQEIEARQAAEEEAAAQAEAEEAECYEEYYEEAYYEPTYSYSDNGDGFKQQGVREYEGRTETYYSSNVAYHYRTGEWEVDYEGYYRDDQGRYVVAASDVPEGTEIETSKGTGIVLDSGCDDGVTDFYVNF